MKKPGELRPEGRMDDPVVQAKLEAALDQLLGECVLVDVRSPAEYDEAHIRGSINIALDPARDGAGLATAIDRITETANGKPVAIVSSCANSTVQAVEALRQAGLGARLQQSIHPLEGGMEAWSSTGMPMARSRLPSPRADRQQPSKG